MDILDNVYILHVCISMQLLIKKEAMSLTQRKKAYMCAYVYVYVYEGRKEK